MRLAEAKSAFDGNWAVIIMTERGSCDAAYRYAVLVANGKVVADARESSGAVDISGTVDPTGKVSVSVSRGEQRADGNGRLSDSAGAGTWTGKSSSAACSGRWQAKRN